MHIAEATHEHARTSRVYTYEVDFDVLADRIDWKADAWETPDHKRKLKGSIPLASPGAACVLEEAVRDAVVGEIDRLQTPS